MVFLSLDWYKHTLVSEWISSLSSLSSWTEMIMLLQNHTFLAPIAIIHGQQEVCLVGTEMIMLLQNYTFQAQIAVIENL